MQAVVPAAGEGSRLRPLTADRPKPMLPVDGRPILSHVFDRLIGLGAEELIVVVGYRGEVIRRHYGPRYRGVPVTYVEQEPRDGLATALLAAEPYVDGDFLSMDGDGLVGADLRPLVERHRETDADCVLLLQEVGAEAARSKAICEIDVDGRLVDIRKRPADPSPPCRIAAPFATFSSAAFDACRRVERSPRGEYELSDAIRTLAAEGDVHGQTAPGPIHNVNTPAELEAVRRSVGTGPRELGVEADDATDADDTATL